MSKVTDTPSFFIPLTLVVRTYDDTLPLKPPVSERAYKKIVQTTDNGENSRHTGRQEKAPQKEKTASKTQQI